MSKTMLQLLSASKLVSSPSSQSRLGLKIALIALCLTITACGNNRMLRPHKIAIQQGNMITQEMVNKLKPGMTKSQVEFVLGTPLIVDTLNTDQWNYIYTLRVASGRVVQKNLNVLFVDGQLNELTGDYKPSEE
jgi:outer membrane protein assembly factor BamE